MTSIFNWASSVAQVVFGSLGSVPEPPAPPAKAVEPVGNPRIVRARATAKKRQKRKEVRQQQRLRAKQATEDVETSSSAEEDTAAEPKTMATEEQATPEDVSTEVIPAGEESHEEEADEEVQMSPAQRRAQKAALKRAKYQERLRLKEALRAEQSKTSILNRLPEDPLQAERDKLRADIDSQVRSIADLKTLTPTLVKMQFPDVQKALDEVMNAIDSAVREMNRKTPRLDLAESVNLDKLQKELLEVEFAEDRDEIAFTRKVDQLVAFQSGETQKQWAAELMALKNQLERRKEGNRRLLTQAHEQETRDRIAARLQTLLELHAQAQTPPVEAAPLDAAALASRPCELSGPMAACLYQPHNLLRKFEKRFLVVGDNPPRQPGQAAEGPRRVGAPRTMLVWSNTPDRIETAVAFLAAAHVERREFPQRMSGGIIGRGGTGIARLEQESGALIAVDGNAELTVVALGTQEETQALWAAIEALKTEPRENEVTSDMPVDGMIARAITSLHRAKLQNIEADSKARITVIINPSDGGRPRILVRAPPSKMEAARQMVEAKLVKEFTRVNFEGPQRAISRLLVPPRNASETAQNRLLHEEFRTLRESLSLFVDRLGPRPGSPQADRSQEQGAEEEDESGLAVVCLKFDEATVTEKVADLIRRASYVIARVPVEREQLRIFTADNRALIEASSETRVSVHATPTGAFFNVVGSHEAIEVAKKVVAEILEREGKVHKFDFGEETEIMNGLLRDRGARVRALENEYNVSISIFRDRNEATLVGDEVSLQECVAELTRLCDERKNRRANMETLILTIEASKIPQLIGRQGATINEIRQTSECDNIDIPRRRDDEETVEVTIVGLKQSVQVAQKMIERILNVNQAPQRQNSDDDRPVRSRGRGRGRGRQAPAEGGAREAPQHVPAHFSGADDEDFPALGSAPMGGSVGAPAAYQGSVEELPDVDPAELEMPPFGSL